MHDTINRLTRSGREVLHQEIRRVHVSGHGNAEELRTIIALLRPRNGHARPRRVPDARGAGAARRGRGVPSDRIVLAENGSIVEMAEAVRVTVEVEAGATFVDGLGVGDVTRRVAARPAPTRGGRRPDRRRHDGVQNGREVGGPR